MTQFIIGCINYSATIIVGPNYVIRIVILDEHFKFCWKFSTFLYVQPESATTPFFLHDSLIFDAMKFQDLKWYLKEIYLFAVANTIADEKTRNECDSQSANSPSFFVCARVRIISVAGT